VFSSEHCGFCLLRSVAHRRAVHDAARVAG
jgi:hypothetical protein